MKNNKTNICFLLPTLGSGGLEMYTLRFINFLDGEFNITIIVRSNTKGELYKAFIDTGVNIVFMPLGYYNLLNIFSYYNFFKKNKFDVVCDFNANFAGIPIILSKWAGIKLRIAYYGQSTHHFKMTNIKLFYTNFLNYLVYKYSTGIFANSISGLDFFFQKKWTIDKRFKVIRNGIELKSILNIKETKEELKQKLGFPNKKYIIGHTGRFAEAKNHYFLLNVAKKLIDIDEDFYFVLLGNGTTQLETYVEKLGIKNNVEILGFKSNVAEYLKAFDVYFFPSITEGQPNALIEAMASGTPIVASDIMPIIETLPDNETKSLISPFDEDAAVKKILEVIQNPKDYMYQSFAIEKYAPEIQFKIFKESLLFH